MRRDLRSSAVPIDGNSAESFSRAEDCSLPIDQSSGDPHLLPLCGSDKERTNYLFNVPFFKRFLPIDLEERSITHLRTYAMAARVQMDDPLFLMHISLAVLNTWWVGVWVATSC